MKINKQKGFNLIELMITVTVAAIVAAFALPEYRYMVRNNCMTTAATELVTSLQFARSEAVKRNGEVTVTAGPPGGAAGAATNEWGVGWHVWFDTNTNSTYDAGEELRVSNPTCQPIVDETGNDIEFKYQPNGFIDNQGNFDVCIDRTGEGGRQVRISSTGRPVTTTGNFTCT